MPGLNTLLIHAGEPRPRLEGAINLPIFQSVNYEGGAGDYDAIRYLRLNNTPNHLALHAKLAALERTEAALVTASGMAAISAALLTTLSSGDHLLMQDCVYGGTHSLVVEDLARLGIAHTRVDLSQPESWAAAVRPETRAFYVESLTNPLLQIGRHAEVVGFCQGHGLVSLIDNTLATPINFRPAELGYDLILHSATKYLNGHSDIAAGVVLGSQVRIEAVRHRLNHLGGCLDANSCFLLHRGLKTLALRVRHQNQSATRLAEWLREQPDVVAVNYPQGSHPGFAGFGGVLSFELANGEAAQRLLGRVQLPLAAASLGGVESLITRPCLTSHSGLSAEERSQAGIAEGLVRYSVGLEEVEDLIADLEVAL